MKTIKLPHVNWIAGGLALALAFMSSAPSASANGYATDIQIGGNLYGVLGSTLPTPASPATITYRINDASTTNVIVSIVNGAGTVATIVSGGTLPAATGSGYAFGLNTVMWGGTNNAGAPVSAGVAYSINITTMASGYSVWTQISYDPGADDAVTGGGTYAYYPNGMTVDDNTNSAFYGRVFLGCSTEGGANPVTSAVIYDGIYKMNADGSFADEGGFGYGGYTTDDGYDAAKMAGEMPSGSLVCPWQLRMGADDRVYMLDYSYEGAVMSFDPEINGFNVVITESPAIDYYGSATHNYSQNPDLGDLSYGIGEFDVTADAHGNGAVWLCNNDYPNWGIWMYHLLNGASDPADEVGTQAVETGFDLSLVSSGGCMIDTNLDIFCGQARNNENAVYDVMDFAGWPTNFGNAGTAGVLPPEGAGSSWAAGYAANQVLWGYGCGVDTTCATDPSFESVRDVTINSRTNPTVMACPMGEGSQFVLGTTGGGIRLLNAQTGAILTATGGMGVITYTNLDNGQAYTCAAWDNVGNLYAATTTRNVWRVWSPPGANTNTTLSVAEVIAPTPVVKITSSTATLSGSCYNVAITFTSTPNLITSEFVLLGSSAVSGPFAPVSGATFTTVSPGVYQVTATVCQGSQYFDVEFAFPFAN